MMNALLLIQRQLISTFWFLARIETTRMFQLNEWVPTESRPFGWTVFYLVALAPLHEVMSGKSSAVNSVLMGYDSLYKLFPNSSNSRRDDVSVQNVHIDEYINEGHCIHHMGTPLVWCFGAKCPYWRVYQWGAYNSTSVKSKTRLMEFPYATTATMVWPNKSTWLPMEMGTTHAKVPYAATTTLVWLNKATWFARTMGASHARVPHATTPTMVWPPRHSSLREDGLPLASIGFFLN
jgi:hypothetical protein